MISDGPQGPSILYTDGSTEPVPSEDIAPPPLVDDLTIEETRTGFEVWFSDRIVYEHGELMEAFTGFLLEDPEVVSVVHDDPAVVMVGGPLTEALRATVTTWWTSRVRSLKLSG